MNKFLCLLAIGLMSTSLLAETIVFRSGEVLAAELSSAPVRVANLPAEETAGPRVYALVTVKIQQGRTLSVEDFSLNALGGLYRCIAIRENNGPFDAKKWHYVSVSPQKKYGMLFALQIPAGQNYNDVKFDLVCNAPGQWRRTTLVFTDRQKQAFTAASGIPNTGRFKASH